MHPRDPHAVAIASDAPFAGYALRPASGSSAPLNRVAACMALLATMVLSGIALGTPRPQHRTAS